MNKSTVTRTTAITLLFLLAIIPAVILDWWITTALTAPIKSFNEGIKRMEVEFKVLQAQINPQTAKAIHTLPKFFKFGNRHQY